MLIAICGVDPAETLLSPDAPRKSTADAVRIEIKTN